MTNKRSNEDSLPIAVADVFRPSGPFTTIRDGKQIGGPSETIRMRVPICERCNSWLNEWVERPAQSLIIKLVEGTQTKAMTRAQSMRVALWCFKTSCMMALKNTARPIPPYPPATLHYMWEHGVPMDSVIVAIGNVPREWRDKVPADEHTKPEPSPFPKMKLPTGSTSRLISIGELCFQVVCMPAGQLWGWPMEGSHESMELGEMSVRAQIERGGFLICVWPPLKEMTGPWSKVPVIDRPTFKALGSMFIR